MTLPTSPSCRSSRWTAQEGSAATALLLGDVYFFMIKAVLSVLSGLTNPFGHTDRTGLGASSTQFIQFGQTDWSE